MTALGVYDQPLQPQYWWIQEEMKQWWHFKGEFVNGRYEHDWLSVAAHKINTNNPNLNTLIRGGGWLYQRLGRERPEATCGGPAIDLLWRSIKPTTIRGFFFLKSFISSEIIFQGNVCWNKKKNNFETSTLDPAMLLLQKTKMQCVALLFLLVVSVFEYVKIIWGCPLPFSWVVSKGWGWAFHFVISLLIAGSKSCSRLHGIKSSGASLKFVQPAPKSMGAKTWY